MIAFLLILASLSSAKALGDGIQNEDLGVIFESVVMPGIVAALAWREWKPSRAPARKPKD